MKHLLALLFLAANFINAQAVQRVMTYSGTNLQYLCTALSTQPQPTVITVSAVSNANPAAATATGHGFTWPSATAVQPLVLVTGGTLNWLPFNGVWAVTPTSANAFTVPVNTTAFGAVTGTLVFTTLAPRLTYPNWWVQKFTYDGSSNMLTAMSGHAQPGAGVTTLTGSSNRYTEKCSDQATLAYQ